MSKSKEFQSSSESLGVADEGNKLNSLNLEFNLLKIITEEPKHALYASATYSQGTDHTLLQLVEML
jgi:hypothetical protein